MSSYIINGGRPLFGSVRVSGSKNAALPILFAAITCEGRSRIHNMPQIGDVDSATCLLTELGAKVTRAGDTVTVDSSSLVYKRPSDSLTASLRASTYLIGAMLARFGRSDIGAYGGCSFAPRPIDLHIYAMERLGAKRVGDSLFLDNPRGAEITFPKPSVGATANAMILAASIEERTELFGCAVEPHILSLADFLTSSGAKIDVEDRHISIRGARLNEGEVTLVPDMIEAATYHILSLLTGGNIFVEGASYGELSCFLSPLEKSGIIVRKSDTDVCLRGKMQTIIDIVAEPFPGFPTDIAPLMAPLLAGCLGGHITDTVFPSRFGYLNSLSAFGLSYTRDRFGAAIYPSRFHSSRTAAPDLRGGMAAIILSLVSEGESIVNSADIVLRGYSDLTSKLLSLGADVKFTK